MKLSNFLILVFLFLNVAVFAQSDLDCKKFRTGTFYTYVNGEISDLVKRTKRKQIEMPNGSKAKIKMKITWLNDCTYKLNFIKANKATYELLGTTGKSKEEIKQEFKQVVICEIISINGNEYIYRATFQDDREDFSVEGKIKKVK